MASLYRIDKTNTEKLGRWVIEYVNPFTDGPKRPRIFFNRVTQEQAEGVCYHIRNLVSAASRHIDLPPTTQAWIDGLAGKKLLDRLIKLKLVANYGVPEIAKTLETFTVSVPFHGEHHYLTSVKSEAHAKTIYDIAVCCVDTPTASSSHLLALKILSPEAYSALNRLDGRNFSIDAALDRERQAIQKQLEIVVRAKFQKRYDRKINKIPPLRTMINNYKEIYPDAPPPTVEASKYGDGLPQEPGIYFVWRDDICEYVGQSVQIVNRARLGHEKIRPGDRISWLPFDRSELNFAEAYYIGIMRPRRNFMGKC